jgi:flagellar hook-basal body complex protein FliE
MNGIAAAQAVAPEILDDLPPLAQGLPHAAPQVAGTPPASSFGELFAQGLEDVNRSLLASQVDMQRLATGDAGNLHRVMIRLEESRVSFQVLLQARNHLLEAYEAVMKMQV